MVPPTSSLPASDLREPIRIDSRYKLTANQDRLRIENFKFRSIKYRKCRQRKV